MKLLQHQSPDTNEKNETSELSNDHLSEGSEYLDDTIRMVEQPLKTPQQSQE